MALDTLELSAVIAASPDDVYAAWMTAKGHAAFTGAPASELSQELRVVTAGPGTSRYGPSVNTSDLVPECCRVGPLIPRVGPLIPQNRLAVGSDRASAWD